MIQGCFTMGFGVLLSFLIAFGVVGCASTVEVQESLNRERLKKMIEVGEIQFKARERYYMEFGKTGEECAALRIAYSEIYPREMPLTGADRPKHPAAMKRFLRMGHPQVFTAIWMQLLYNNFCSRPI